MKRPLANILSVTGADALGRLLGFFATAYLARMLGAGSFGLLNIATAVLSYVQMISSPGLHTYGTREVAARRPGYESLPADILGLRVILAAALIILTGMICMFFVESSESREVILVVASAGLPLAMSLDWFFQGREQLVVVSAGKVLLSLIYLVFVLLLVSPQAGTLRAAQAYLLAIVISTLVLLLVFLREGGSLRIRWELHRWGGLLHAALPLGISSLLAQTIMNLPVLLVGALQSQQAAGHFSAAMKLVFFVLMIDRVFFALFLPVASRLARGGGEEFRHIVILGLRVILLILTPIVIAGAVFASLLIPLVFGAGYAESVPVLQVSMVYAGTTVVNTLFMCALIARNREAEFVKAMAVGTAVLVALCIILPQWYGVVGTAVGLVIGEAVIAVLQFVKLRKEIPFTVGRTALPVVAGVLGMMLILFGLSSLHPILRFMASVAGFSAIVLLSGGLRREELRFLRERFV